MSNHLNEKTEKTEKVIHLLTTTVCDRNCKYCCNKQYNLDDVPTVTEEELWRAETICLTGGEPFKYSSPSELALHLKSRYPNIKAVYVYTNAAELWYYMQFREKFSRFTGIDGLNVSLKCETDVVCFENGIVSDEEVLELPNNLLYVFDNVNFSKVRNCGNFKYVERVWQPDFTPADDSIFRRI